ncbi:DYW domain containing protein [Trema orientale]|uniref:DYW domain containing protein n=1 Tax=Trema orientale TaxID=63057 RepID=A0A2P5EQG0_TREOI|nr:DYW domain containing protein [Trema orientale]
MLSKQFLFTRPSLFFFFFANPSLRRRFSSSTSHRYPTNANRPSLPTTIVSPTPYIPIAKCISLLQFCASSKPKLMQIHAFSIRHGVPITDPDMGKHLIFAIVALSAPMGYAHNVFSQIDNPNIFTFNTMIRGYAESENPRPAIELYRHMRAFSSVKADTHSYPFLLKALAKLTAVREGEMVHSVVLRDGFESLVFVQNALLHMYGCFGCVESAHKVFELMPQRDLVAWNTVINGFALNGRPNEALVLFRDMGFEGVEPDGFTMVSVMSACGELGALALGRRAHVYVLKVGFLNSNLHANNALLDLYAKCGSIRDAKRVFNEANERSVVSWTSLIVGLAINGFGKEALELFKELENEGLVPTEITFVGVLYACSHCGMVNEGFNYFGQMEEKYGIVPRIEHYGCMIDLLGRAGLVKEAYEYIQNMPLKPNAVIWRTLLGACTIHGDLVLGELARSRLQQLEPGHSGDYILLSNLYASENRWSDVQKVRRAMLRQGVRKTPGYSLVELGNRVFEFMMADRSHPQSEETYAKLAEITSLLRLEGYVPHTANVLADIEEEEKETALSYHSEKIAVAFMLVNTAPRTPIRILKNLRVCVDCHVVFKLISKVYGREIVVRDCTRFHHFGNGSCSCGDYW